MSDRDLSQMSMLELFRLDAEGQIQSLTSGLLALERDGTAADQLEACMRATHSLKGAARVVGLEAGVGVAHAMEDCFVAAQRGDITVRQAQIDVLLQGVDLLNRIASTPEASIARWDAGEERAEIAAFGAALAEAASAQPGMGPVEREVESEDESSAAAGTGVPFARPIEQHATTPVPVREGAESTVRVSAENLNRLLGLAGESLVESRQLKLFAASLLRVKRLQEAAIRSLDRLSETLQPVADELADAAVKQARDGVHASHELLSQRLGEMEMFEGRSTNLAHRLYDAVLASRMRPFADGTGAFPRMVRDLGRSLGKDVRLEMAGQAVQVDRDILEKLEAPLAHLLRNAVDHGIDTPAERRLAGKPAEGVVRLEARHSAGVLQITVSDDGRGIDLDELRTTIVDQRLTDAGMASKLSEAELLEFLFLPGFTTKSTVSEISGRGVGLDVVKSMIKQVRGTIRVSSRAGTGAQFQLQLPLTLSVVRTLLVEVGGEPYAFPLAQVVRTLKLPRSHIHVLEGRQHFELDGRSVGLVSAHQVLGGPAHKVSADELLVVIVGDASEAYGLVVERLLGERELVVQPLDPRLGKVKDIAAGALTEDGAPVLIVDVHDMVHSVERLVSAGQLRKVERGAGDAGGAVDRSRKRVLVVDDSLTVRELERKLLDSAGYDVEVAVDGVNGWNVLRSGHFDLVITDVDMPRMDGIELVGLIKKDMKLKSLPVMIVSYKDREEDRQRGLEAGADYYLAKGSFHDETLLQAVMDLIGSPGLRAAA